MRLAAQDAKRQQAESRVTLAEAIGVPAGALEGVEIRSRDWIACRRGWTPPPPGDRRCSTAPMC